MTRATRGRLSATLLGISLLSTLSPFWLSRLDSLDNADFLIKLAVIPGCFILGGLVFLINGLVEHYADVLPRRLGCRSSQENEWRAMYPDHQMENVIGFLEQFTISHGFRAVDAFQFRPHDRIRDLLREFYPDKEFPDCLLGDEDALGRKLWRENAVLHELVDLRRAQHESLIHVDAANPWWNRIPSIVGFAILGAIVLAVLVALVLS